MNRKLIVVADDFGFSEAYNYGVIKAYREGIVTVLSLMSNMEAASHAISLAKEFPEVNLSQHTNFVQGSPISKNVPSLTNSNGEFYRSSEWKSEYLNDSKCTGNISPTYEDCKIETYAQLNRFKELTGNYPNHFEGHSVMTKNVIKAFQEISSELKIHAMGMPEVETDEMYAAHELGFDVTNYVDILNKGIQVEDFINDRFQLLKSKYEINILHFHPGFLDQYLLDNTSLTYPRCRDLETLCDPRVRTWLHENNIELVDFKAVYK
ncbi:MAG: ChbG/HpnK family deacetylase [Bacilli bacterium]